LSSFGSTFTQQVYISARSKNHFQLETSVNGPVNSVSVLVWEDTENGSRFALSGLLPIPPGFPSDALNEALIENVSVAFGNILNHFGTTGTIAITVDQTVTTPDF
jgi:hypothetical protein